MVDSKPWVNGRAAPAGAAVTVNVDVLALLAAYPSVPPLGAETVTEKVCAAVDNPEKVFSVRVAEAAEVSDPVQL